MSYNHETIVDKNITLSFEFERYLQEHLALLVQIPDGAEIVLLPKDDPELYRINVEDAQKAQKQGQIIVCVEIEAVAPPRSRLVNPQLTTQPIISPMMV